MSLLSPQMSLLVQPLTCPPAHIEIQLPIAALFFPGLVDVLQRLKGQHCSADFAGLAFPDQFHLAFVGKEEAAVLLRQRLPLLDELDEVALLGVGEDRAVAPCPSYYPLFYPLLRVVPNSAPI